MRWASVCSGIGAPECAWGDLWGPPVYVAEIAPFPSAVLKAHFPEVTNYGDFTRIPGGHNLDLLVGGTPCQAFSVAGLRAGLADPRGNLALEFLALLDRERPRWMVWENVYGVLSSISHDAPDEVPPPDDLAPGCEWTTEQEYDADEVSDFGCFLAGLSELGYRWAYRVLDAQYFGVPQRRRRVFVVGYLGDWRPPAAVLFEPESLSGHPAPSRRAGQNIAGAPKGRAGNNCSPERGDLTLVAFDTTQITSPHNGSNPQPGGPCHPLSASAHPPVVAFAHNQDWSLHDDVSPTLTDSHGGAPAIAFKDHGADASEDLAPTLRAMGHDGSHANGGGQLAVAVQTSQSGVRTGAANPTLDANNGSRRHNGVLEGMTVRRLTPLECERLQGFPDVQKTVRILVCSSDQQKNAARAAIRSRKSQMSASPADASASAPFVLPADESSNTHLPGHDLPVALSVLVDSERAEVRISSQGRCLWSASGAGEPSSSPLPMPVADFVPLAALMTSTAVPGIPSGRAASLQSSDSSLPQRSGSAFVPVSGHEIAALAGDAALFTTTASRCLKSTTSEAGSSSPSYEQNLATLCCCVAAATSGFIPDVTGSGNSYALSVEVVAGYTAITYRGKPAKDGPRYMSLGNSMAVPVVRWLGRRIQMVEDVTAAQEDVA